MRQTQERITERADARRRILRALRCDPQHVFSAPELADLTGLTILETVLTLSGLALAGDLERVRPGRYRHTDQPLGQMAPEEIADVYRMPPARRR